MERADEVVRYGDGELRHHLFFDLRSFDSCAGDVVFDISPGEPTQDWYDDIQGKGLRELFVRRYICPR